MRPACWVVWGGGRGPGKRGAVAPGGRRCILWQDIVDYPPRNAMYSVTNYRIAMRGLYCSHLSVLSILVCDRGCREAGKPHASIGLDDRAERASAAAAAAAAGKPRCVRECQHSQPPQSLQSARTHPDTVDTMPLAVPASQPNRRPGPLTLAARASIPTAQRPHEMPPAACACETTGHLSTVPRQGSTGRARVHE